MTASLFVTNIPSRLDYSFVPLFSYFAISIRRLHRETADEL